MSAGLLANPTAPVEVWTEGMTIVLVQLDDSGTRHEIRITRDRIDGVIKLLQQTRDDA